MRVHRALTGSLRDVGVPLRRLRIDDEAFEGLYGHTSHPIEKEAQRFAVRVILQFVEELMDVIEVKWQSQKKLLAHRNCWYVEIR